MRIKGIITLFLISCVVIFTAQNYHVVEVKFMVWSFNISKALIIFICVLLGISIGWAMSILSRRTKEKKEKTT